MELNEKLTRFRREQELSQTELAQSLGVTRQAVSGWERGTAVPSAEKLIALSRLYGIPLNELVNGAEPPGEELGAEVAEPEPAPPEAEEAPRRAALSWRVAPPRWRGVFCSPDYRLAWHWALPCQKSRRHQKKALLLLIRMIWSAKILTWIV